ncbi:hypothetical protein BDB00DRAFT_884480 [Zychaea mexicana]|uniref:uncharacterized protein n=1 Tax=Zychaea mexicana TaxID=64656 RepID=UPI0022FE3BF9|nr:uncharacterized protein BDB00DRAFT_884480 [Zychaea mexicana]KAI9489508.1 hypothetical protein BDB00DRAFT_884480 [Zychaea mexicana]
MEQFWAIAKSNRRPFTIGKQVAAWDPFTYHCYVDTPPTSPRIANTVISNDEAINLKPTKHCVLDFFNCIASKDAPVNRKLYTFVDIYSATQVTDWLSKDGRFGYSKREKQRTLWIVKQEHWVNLCSYARKSRTNEPMENKIKSIQKMTDCLRIKCHCAKVFLSPICSSGLKLCQRDTKPNLNLMDSVRHKHGDMAR